MFDWLVVWGATQAVGFVFKPILEDLAQDAAKDWAKDLFNFSSREVPSFHFVTPGDESEGRI